MAFSITSFKADTYDKVVSVYWVYSNDDGAISNEHVLATPAGDFALDAVTQSTLVGWLEDQLQNTAAEFDAAIATAKANNDYRLSLTQYDLQDNNTYEIPTQTGPDPE